MNTDIKVSIVTICFNAEQHIEDTIQSVLSQTYPNIEYLVIDGKSTDKTGSIIQQYQQQIDHILCEADNGIADAMNKAIPLASGDYILYLHADDYLLNNHSIADAVSIITEDKQQRDIYAFDVIFGNEHQQRQLASTGFSARINLKTGVLHQGAFCARQLFDDIGLFDTQFRIAMDYDWFLRAHRQRRSIKMIHKAISMMRDCGISSQTDWPQLEKRLKEEQRVHKKNQQSWVHHCLYAIWWSLYPRYKKAIS